MIPYNSKGPQICGPLLFITPISLDESTSVLGYSIKVLDKLSHRHCSFGSIAGFATRNTIGMDIPDCVVTPVDAVPRIVSPIRTARESSWAQSSNWFVAAIETSR
jgi:hypothetical protein